MWASSDLWETFKEHQVPRKVSSSWSEFNFKLEPWDLGLLLVGSFPALTVTVLEIAPTFLGICRDPRFSLTHWRVLYSFDFISCQHYSVFPFVVKQAERSLLQTYCGLPCTQSLNKTYFDAWYGVPSAPSKFSWAPLPEDSPTLEVHLLLLNCGSGCSSSSKLAFLFPFGVSFKRCCRRCTFSPTFV